MIKRKHTYNVAQVISLSRNEYSTIDNIQIFSKHIKDLPPLQEKDVPYDVESLFTNFLINETIKYILDQMYNK